MSWTSDRARVAVLSRDRDPDDPDLIAAKRQLKSTRLKDQATRIVEDANTYPPLNPAQRDAILAAFAGFGLP